MLKTAAGHKHTKSPNKPYGHPLVLLPHSKLNQNPKDLSGLWWCMPVILPPRRKRQDGQESKASTTQQVQGHMRPCFKKILLKKGRKEKRRQWTCHCGKMRWPLSRDQAMWRKWRESWAETQMSVAHVSRRKEISDWEMDKFFWEQTGLRTHQWQTPSPGKRVAKQRGTDPSQGKHPGMLAHSCDPRSQKVKEWGE